MNNSVNNHKKNSSSEINCSVITLSDSRKQFKDDPSGNYITEILESKYNLVSRTIIPDDKKELLKFIEEYSAKCDIIITTGGTGLSKRDITVETVEQLFDKKIDGFGELFRLKSFEEIGESAILSRATAGVYNETVIFSLPGSLNAVKTAMNLITNELPHIVYHTIN